MERTRSETLKLFVVSDVGRRSTLLSSTRATRWWQSSWPKLAAPSPAGGPAQQSGIELLKRTGLARGHDCRAFKQILQIVIAVAVQAADGTLFLGSFELSLDPSVIGAALGLDAESTVRPQLSLGAETMRGLQDAPQYR
jgi:hypothetical protein